MAAAGTIVNLFSTISAEGEAFLPDFRAVLRGGPFSFGEAAPWSDGSVTSWRRGESTASPLFRAGGVRHFVLIHGCIECSACILDLFVERVFVHPANG